MTNTFFQGGANIFLGGTSHPLLRAWWFSTAVLRAACGPQAPFVRPSAVFQQTSLIFCVRLRSATKQNVSIGIC